jgi:hypothetical protein
MTHAKEMAVDMIVRVAVAVVEVILALADESSNHGH